jgi:DDE domain
MAVAFGRGLRKDQRQALLCLAGGRSRRGGVGNGGHREAGQGRGAEVSEAPNEEYGRPRSVVTDRLGSYPAAMKEIGNADRHEVGRRLNNRAENSHQPFRRRERPMQRFRSAKTLQKFSSVHAQLHNYFNQERHLVAREVYKQRRSAVLAEWRALAA